MYFRVCSLKSARCFIARGSARTIMGGLFVLLPRTRSGADFVPACEGLIGAGSALQLECWFRRLLPSAPAPYLYSRANLQKAEMFFEIGFRGSGMCPENDDARLADRAERAGLHTQAVV